MKQYKQNVQKRVLRRILVKKCIFSCVICTSRVLIHPKRNYTSFHFALIIQFVLLFLHVSEFTSFTNTSFQNRVFVLRFEQGFIVYCGPSFAAYSAKYRDSRHSVSIYFISINMFCSYLLVSWFLPFICVVLLFFCVSLLQFHEEN